MPHLIFANPVLPRPRALSQCLLITLLWHALICNLAPAQAPPETFRDQDFERTIFGRQRTAAEARRTCTDTLTARIAEVDRLCALSEAQKEKLRLMGQGDIKRFFDLVERLRDELKNSPEPWHGHQLFDATGDVRMMFLSGLFHEYSLFRKGMSNILDTKQLVVYVQQLERSRQNRHEDNAKRVMSLLETSVYLSDAEQNEFSQLILREIPPCLSDGPYEVHYLLLQMGRLAEKRPERFSNRRLRELILSYKHQFESMEPILRRSGYFPEEEIEQPAMPEQAPNKPAAGGQNGRRARRELGHFWNNSARQG
jgi:hypothetical protein